MGPNERRAMRREQIERWFACDMEVAEFCQLSRIGKTTFYKWLARFREEEPETFGGQSHAGWIELAREEAHAATHSIQKVGPAAPGAAHAGPGSSRTCSGCMRRRL